MCISIVKKGIFFLKNHIRALKFFLKINKKIISSRFRFQSLLKSQGYIPEITILDWTQCIFLAKKIRRFFPSTKIIGVEQDVSFLNYKRRINLKKTPLEQKKARKQYNMLKKKELRFLSYIDQIDVFNQKDANLLIENNISNSKIKIIPPYFDDYSNITRKPVNKNIIFYGAMNRPENYECCIWFIENVFSNLPDSYTFTIIGAYPNECLQKYASERIIITGFINDITPYLETAFCSVVPLLLGAGIKIKVLELMSAGIPVLTNLIGIEGIPAKNGLEYLHCESAEDYINAINKLSNDITLQNELSKNSRMFIINNFNYLNESYI